MGEKIGSLIIDIAGTSLTKEDIDLLRHPIVGGIIFFARNYKTRQQLIELCSAIRKVRNKPLLIMVDQEGGRVQRFQGEFTRIPHMAVFGQLYDKDKQLALRLARECAWLLASELLVVGVDLSLTPVLDLQNAVNKAIGDRAFHHDPNVVIHLAEAFMDGLHQAGMSATAKHFPGHGAVDVDSHEALPSDGRMLDEVLNTDMIPFAAMIKAGIDNIMAAHIVYPQIDKFPVSFSKRWLKDILRQQLNFKGIIISDDLNMKGADISTNYADRVQLAREAGCDITLLCNNRGGVIKTLDQLNPEHHQIEKSKWQSLVGDMSRLNMDLQSQTRWQQIHNQINQLGNKTTHERITGS